MSAIAATLNIQDLDLNSEIRELFEQETTACIGGMDIGPMRPSKLVSDCRSGVVCFDKVGLTPIDFEGTFGLLKLRLFGPS